MTKYLLGTDNGGTVAKAALFTLDGREVAAVGQKTEMHTPQPGWTQRDPDRLWQATAASIRAVLAESRISPADVAAVACTGHGNGLYLVDSGGRPVRPAIVSTDSRAKDYVARWYKDGTHQKILPHTMQSLWPGQPNALLAWLRDHEPQTLGRAAWVLMCKDYVRMRLCGEVHAELTDMSGTNLMSVRDGAYCHEVLEAFGLAEFQNMLPPILRPEAIAGCVTAEAAAETGLREGTPVAAGLFDIDACALATGIVDESQMSMIAGTWGINQYICRQPVIDADLFMCSRYCIPGYYLIPEASPTSASNLEWFATQFFQAERETAELAGTSVYELCNTLVATTRPEASTIVFLPFLFGSNAEPDARAALVGLASWHTRADVLRAIYEGVAFGHRVHFDRLMRFRGPPESIRLTGGAARSSVWVQIFADVYQTPVEIPQGTELGAKGAAMVAGLGVGCFASYQDAVARMVQVSHVCQPAPARKDLYVRKLERYRRLLAALDPVWKDLL